MVMLRIIAIISLTAMFGCSSPKVQGTQPARFTAMAWNIWHGGREDGDEVGPQRVIEVIKESGADIVAMQETYGSGELISDALGFHFHPRGTNVSIHSRYPIIEDVSVFHEFKCVGAIVELPNKTPIAFYSIWLPYGAEIWAEGTRKGKPVEQLLAACDASKIDLEQIRDQIQERLAKTSHKNLPIFIAGDFNSMSHFDYTDKAKEQFGYVIDWPTSHVMTDAGFIDSYREIHSDIDRSRDRTWSPRFLDQQQDRIDFIYFSDANFRVTKAEVIDTHSVHFPSDHAALVAEFEY